MNKEHQIFQSFLADDLCAFIAYKRALARRYVTEERALCLFDRYLVKNGVGHLHAITPELIETFLSSRTRNQPRSYNHLVGVIRRFFDWMVGQEKIPLSPVRTQLRCTTAQRRPFLLNRDQILQLLKVAAWLPDNARAPMRGETYVLIFTLMYGLGLRVGEVSRLQFQDVNVKRQLLVIRETKFSKSRLVPFGPKIGERIAQYLEECTQERGPFLPVSPVFSFIKGNPVHPCTISQTFHKLVLSLNLDIPPGMRPPCVHSLRHSFAVGTLIRWYRTGIDPGTRLVHLATFLGHVDPMSTAVYLTITSDLLQEAGRRFEQFASSEQGRA